MVGVGSARATERGLQSAGVLVSDGGFGILRAFCAVLTFLRDKSRASAAIIVGELAKCGARCIDPSSRFRRGDLELKETSA